MKFKTGLLLPNLCLISAAFFWGMTFVAQKTSMDVMGPFSFTGIRFLLGGLFLIPLTQMLKFDPPDRIKPSLASNFPIGILILGLLIFTGINLQQIGLVYTTPTHSALLTGVYIFLVPLFMVFIGRKLHWGTWCIGLMMMFGIYLLTVGDKLISDMNLGDLLSLICSVFWAAHIIWLDKMNTAGHNPLKISIYQCMICGTLSLVLAMIFEELNWNIIVQVLPQLLFASVFSISIAFTLQVIGQRKVPPSFAAIILSSEAMFGSLADYIFLDTILTLSGYIGAVFIIIGVILVQRLPISESQK